MIAKILKRLQWILTILLVILLIYALLTKNAMILADFGFPIWVVLWVLLSLWVVNRSRLEHITNKWKKHQEKVQESKKVSNETSPKE